MRRTAPLLLALFAACAPPPTPPAPPSPAPPPAPAPAPAAEPAPLGPPVFVPQRLPKRTNLTELDPAGRLVLVGDPDGLHVVEVEAGHVRGVLEGCADQAGFGPEGRWVVAVCRKEGLARIWDLDTDTTRDVALADDPWHLAFPGRGRLAAVLSRGAVQVLDLAAGTVLRRLGDPGLRGAPLEIGPSGWVVGVEEAGLLAWSPSAPNPLRVPLRAPPHVVSLAPSGASAVVGIGPTVTRVHLDSGQVGPPIPACAAKVEAVAWSDDEQRLVVSCRGEGEKAPARVAVYSAAGVEERELVRTPHGAFRITVAGDEVGTLHRNHGGQIHSLRTGELRHRVDPPEPWRRPDGYTRDLGRVLFGEGVDELVVFDRRGGQLGPHRHPRPIQASQVARDEGLLFVYVGDPPKILDLATGAQVLRPQFPVLPDQASDFIPSRRGFRIVDHRTGDVRTSPPLELEEDPELSPTGTFVTAIESAPRKGGGDYALQIYDARTLARVRVSLGKGWEGLWWSPGDRLVATFFNTGRTRGGEPCDGQRQRACQTIRVHDPRTGRLLSSIRPPDDPNDRSPYPPARMPWITTPYRIERGDVPLFASDGEHLIFRDRVYATRSGALAWPVPQGLYVEAAVAGRRELVVTGGGTVRTVDQARGKALRELGKVDELLDVSADGAWVLARREGAIWLWETATGAGKPTAIDPKEAGPFLLRDGSVVFYPRRGDLATHRFADGRTLYRPMDDLSFAYTDDGVFDPPASAVAMVRLGPSVRRSPMAPLSAGGALVHPGLVGDFMAGKAVGRR